jgi:hypothetical protein
VLAGKYKDNFIGGHPQASKLKTREKAKKGFTFYRSLARGAKAL